MHTCDFVTEGIVSRPITLCGKDATHEHFHLVSYIPQTNMSTGKPEIETHSVEEHFWLCDEHEARSLALESDAQRTNKESDDYIEFCKHSDPTCQARIDGAAK
jgi:hypothetical protein